MCGFHTRKPDVLAHTLATPNQNLFFLTMSSDNNWNPGGEREIVGVVDSLIPISNRPGDSTAWTRLLVNIPDNQQQNVELAACHIRIIKDEESGVGAQVDLVEQGFIWVKIHQEASHADGIWNTKVAKFYVQDQRQGDWIRKCFGFRRAPATHSAN